MYIHSLGIEVKSPLQTEPTRPDPTGFNQAIVVPGRSEPIHRVESAPTGIRLKLDRQNVCSETLQTEPIQIKTSRIGSSRLCLQRALEAASPTWEEGKLFPMPPVLRPCMMTGEHAKETCPIAWVTCLYIDGYSLIQLIENLSALYSLYGFWWVYFETAKRKRTNFRWKFLSARVTFPDPRAISRPPGNGHPLITSYFDLSITCSHSYLIKYNVWNPTQFLSTQSMFPVQM